MKTIWIIAFVLTALRILVNFIGIIGGKTVTNRIANLIGVTLDSLIMYLILVM